MRIKYLINFVMVGVNCDGPLYMVLGDFPNWANWVRKVHPVSGTMSLNEK